MTLKNSTGEARGRLWRKTLKKAEKNALAPPQAQLPHHRPSCPTTGPVAPPKALAWGLQLDATRFPGGKLRHSDAAIPGMPSLWCHKGVLACLSTAVPSRTVPCYNTAVCPLLGAHYSASTFACLPCCQWLPFCRDFFDLVLFLPFITIAL